MARSARRVLGLLTALTLPGAFLYSFTSPIPMVGDPPEHVQQAASGLDMQYLFFLVWDHPDEMSWPRVDADGVIVLQSPQGLGGQGGRAWLQRFSDHRAYPRVLAALDAGRLRVDRAPARSYRHTRELSIQVSKAAQEICRCSAGPSSYSPRIVVVGQTDTPGLATALARRFDPREIELHTPFAPL